MKALSLSESMPRIGTGNCRRSTSSASTTRDCSRATRGIASVQPEQTSVATRLHRKAPCRDVPFQRRDEAGKDGLQTLAADAVGGFPQDDQGLPNGLVVGAASHDGSFDRNDRISGEQSDGVLAVAAGHRDELVEDLALVLLGGRSVALAQQVEQFALRLLADLRSGHGLPPGAW